MANLWYKVAEYYGESSHRGQQLDSNLWRPDSENKDHQPESRETYWNNLSSMGPNGIVAYTETHGNWKSLFHRTCMPDVEKNNFEDKNGQTYSDFQPVSFQELRQQQQPLWSKPLNKNFHKVPGCTHCFGVIVPSRPHSEKECGETKFGSMDKGKCSDVWQLRPEGSFHHICQHGLNANCVVHGGFDPKDAFPQGHISDEQVKAYGTAGDLEVLLGSEAEYRVRNNLPINLGGRNNP